MPVWRKWSALTALLAMLLPGLATAARHEADDHVTAHEDLDAVLHGHEHAAGTPAHEHSLTPSPNMTSGHSRVFLVSILRAENVGLSGLPLQPPVIGRPAPSDTASPPAGARSLKSVLRI